MIMEDLIQHRVVSGLKTLFNHGVTGTLAKSRPEHCTQ